MVQIFLRPEARHESLARVARVRLEGLDLEGFISAFEAAIGLGVRPEALSDDGGVDNCVRQRPSCTPNFTRQIGECSATVALIK